MTSLLQPKMAINKNIKLDDNLSVRNDENQVNIFQRLMQELKMQIFSHF